MVDYLSTICLFGVKLLVYSYEIITFIPYVCIFKPWRRLQKRRRLKGIEVKKGIYRNVENVDQLSTSIFTGDEVKTLADLFARSIRLFGPMPSLGYREIVKEEDEVQANGKVFKKLQLSEYHWLTYTQFGEKANSFGKGLLDLGLQSKQRVVIFAETRVEWQFALQACFKYNFVVVTLYATLGDEGLLHGIKQSEAECVIVSDALLRKLKSLDIFPQVKHIIYMDRPGCETPSEGHSQTGGFPATTKVQGMSSVMEKGSEITKCQFTPAERYDPAMIVYTSGSTGLPKGVIMSHYNMLAAGSGQIPAFEGLCPDDIYMAYLPLAHVLELACEIGSIAFGAKIGYGSPQTLTNESSMILKGTLGDAPALQPTLVAAVPTVMDRVSKSVWDKINSGNGLAKALFTFGYQYKLRKLEMGFDIPIFTRIFFRKVRYVLGGKVRLMLSGGAPLSEDTHRFINVCFCCPVLQGYGLTETCGAGSITMTEDSSVGTVGAPKKCCEIRLRDWPEGNYTVNDKPNPRGEILIGGGCVTIGYFKNEAKTAEDYFDDSTSGLRFFCTGDIGEMREDGTLKIIDRKKDLVKLQGGEYVSLGKVETALMQCTLVEQVAVVVDPMKDNAVCLVVVARKHFRALVERVKPEVKIAASEELVKYLTDEKVISACLSELHKTAVAQKCVRYEIPTRVTLLWEPWMPESGLVSATLKVCRRQIAAAFEREIKTMYSSS